tara:strand:- start:71 stop:298 length:228 start_codon:yes stop_codon:yes gene_type:complete
MYTNSGDGNMPSAGRDGRRLSGHDYGTVHRPRYDELQQELGANAGAAGTVDLVVARYREDSAWLVDVERELPMVR